MFRLTMLSSGPVSLLALGFALGGCGEIKPQKPGETDRTRAEAQRHKDACASSAAYDRIKRVIFSEAGNFSSHRANLATLEEFSFVRMEDPVVVDWDPALDITRCRGRFVLDVPPGSEQALGGEHQLQADVTYTAQGAADASGLVYVIKGAEPIVGKLEAFNLAGATYQPLPAVDTGPPPQQTANAEDGATAVNIGRESRPAPDRPMPTRVPDEQLERQGSAPAIEQKQPAIRELTRATSSAAVSPNDAGGEATVRAFYNALGQGDGGLASAQVIPAKRSSRAYSPDAISRFYGRLAEPLRLTSVSKLSDDLYRVRYRYAASGSRCNGSAVVRLTLTEGHPLIRSITAGSGC